MMAPIRDTYEAYRVGGSLEKVIAGTREILKAREALKSKQRPMWYFNFWWCVPNEHQVPEVYALAKN